MHGRVCEERNQSRRRRHMLISSSRVIASVEGGGSSCVDLSSSASFCKDGRKISVGDCALFKPPQDCPPFIGIIRLINAEKDNQLKLGVNWLYRPTELKLGKGILLEAEPNELFYSFHEDNIPAASLLHPCKVAFLPRGVKLPSGICSFVCRRVYDVTNERLWWLTDQDYVDDRQLEVDKLLFKTRSEMHTTLQQGGRSPKSINSPTTSQEKDGIRNNNSFIPHGKGRKREHIDHGSESVKRERPTRIDDTGSGLLRTESGLKSEISKFTEKGGLVDSDGVEKLVQLMLPERNEKKIGLVCRAVLAGVVAATDKFDCLSRFVQLRGLHVFDEWLQEVHKGKVGDGGSPKDSNRLVDDFLLVLLRALDKLPVNLNALQTCNIGKSVNHLRSHKNSEIGKKARSLVDTWKKRVEAEMDAKSGSKQGVSWPGRLTPGGRHSSVSAEATKTPSSHLHSSKSVSVKVQVENTKCVATSPGSTRSAPSSGSGGTVSKDGQQQNSGFSQINEVKDVMTGEKAATGSPPVVVRDEHSRVVKDSDQAAEIFKGTSSSLENEFNSGERHGGTHSSMNALIESCVRYSETNASLVGSDDVGMNLLASVAADEMSKSPVASPSVSQPSNSLMNENSAVGNNTKLTTSDDEQHQAVTQDGTTVSNEKGEQYFSGMQLEESELKNESKTGDPGNSSNSGTEDLQRLVDQCLESNDNSYDVVASPALPTTAGTENVLDDSDFGKVNEIKADVTSEADRSSDSTKRVASSMLYECRAIDMSKKEESVAVENTPLDGCGDKKEEKPKVRNNDDDGPVSSGFSRVMNAFNNMVVNHVDQKDVKIKQDCDASVGDASAGLDSSITKGKVEPMVGDLENIKVKDQHSGLRVTPGVSLKDAEDIKRRNGPKISAVGGDEADECTSAARDSSSASGGSEMDARVKFDLNEGFDGEDVKPGITVVAAAKGAFVPPEDLLKNKGAVGWRGSAATSAFRPAEPRKSQDVLVSVTNVSSSGVSTFAVKQTRTFLDFDLNVPDERLLEDLASQRSGNATICTLGVTNSFDQVRPGVMGSALGRSSGALDLDLNKLDDSTDMNDYTMSSSRRKDPSFQQVKLSSPGGRRDFDLNDGPGGDDTAAESSMGLSQHPRSVFPSQPSLSGIRVNGENMANFSTWFPSANAYSAVSMPPIMPERSDQPFPVIANCVPPRILGPTTGVSSFTPEGYWGPVLSSSQAMPFQSTTFQYPVFPFGNRFPIPSANFSGASTTHTDSSISGRACLPGVNSQMLGPGVPVPSNYPRPYIVGLPNGGSNGGVLNNNAKWFRSGLDLNSGPGGHDAEGREESTLVSRQLSSPASLLLKEDQGRMYQMSGGVLKRKEPEGGWDGYRR